MAAAAGIAAAAGAATTLAGGIIEAKGQLRASKDKAASLRFQASQAEEETVDKIVDLERQRLAIEGSQRATFGASGVKVNVGSPLAVLAETEYRADVQRSRLERAGQAQSALLRTGAISEERIGRARYTATLLTTFGNLASMAGRAGMGGGGGS